MECNLFNQSYIERDLELTGGERVISRIFGNTIDFSGVITSDGEGYKLVADIVPDQSRVFKDVKVRIDGIDITNFKIRERSDGKKVVSIDFPLDPIHFKNLELQIDVVWNYSDDDLLRPDVFESTIVVELGITEYTTEKLSNGLTRLAGSYGVQANDFWRPIGYVNVIVNPLKKHFTGLMIKYYPNYKDYPERYEIANYDNMINQLPFKLRRKIFVDLDTLKVQNKKFDFIWQTDDGELIETFMVDTDTIGYATEFSAPVPIEINEDAYPSICLKNIYRNFVFEPQYYSYYKGNHELRGQDLSFRTKLPLELSLRDYKISVLVNGEEVGYKATPISTNEYNYTQYDVPLNQFNSNIDSIEVKATAIYPNGIEVNYGVIFTELF